MGQRANSTLTWKLSGQRKLLSSKATIRRSELVHYCLTGTDDYFFDRKMVASSSVKTDLVLDDRGKAQIINR